MGSVHEVNPSLWVSDESHPPGFPQLDGDVACEVAIVGAGIAGLTTARLLAGEGVRVCVVDAGEVCAGATGYTTAKVTSLHRLFYAELRSRHGDDAARTYADANQAAVERVARFVAEDSIACDLVRASAFTYTERDDMVAAIEAEVDAASGLGLSVRLAATTALPFPVKRAVVLDNQLHLHPRRYCFGLAQAVVGRGSAVHEHTRALDVKRHSSGVTVRTDQGTITCEHAVLATHLPFLDRGGFFARAHPHRSYAMAVRARGDVPEGMYISAEEPTRSIRPAPEGRMIVGGEGHKAGQDPDTRRRYDALEAWTRQHFDIAAVEHRWSAQDYTSIDGLPYIGRLTPRDQRVLVATAFRKWGMTNGTVAGEIIADTVMGRDNRWAATFDATRAKPRQSVGGFLRENLDVARHFVGDRLAGLRAPASETLAPASETLAPGEGRVVRHAGSRVAAYRDDDEQLRAVSASCTHLGCQVTFNTAERSWDCPCHGSRFDTQGRVLEGPATKDLALEPLDTPKHQP